MLSVGGSASGGLSNAPSGGGGTDTAGGAPQGGAWSCENGHRLFDLPATDLIGAPVAVVADDVNGDGLTDLVAAIASTNEIAVLNGNGNGTFAPPIRNTVAGKPLAIALADVDRDGLSDLVSVNQASDSVSILLGDGRGSFVDRFDLSIVERAGNRRTQPTAVAVGDFNRDGWPDLAVADRGVAMVSIWLGSGGGAFVEASMYNVGGVPESVVQGDFNGDGKLDLVNASRGDGTLNVLLGNGDGTFGRRADIATGSAARWVGSTDFNADGRLDLVVLTEGSVGGAQTVDPNLALLYGRGDGSFAPAVTYGIDSGTLPSVMGDVNRDGSPDLIVPERTTFGLFRTVGGQLAALLGKRDGKFEHGPANSNMLLAECYALGDFDRDGNLDLVTTSSYGSRSVYPAVEAVSVGSFVVAFGQGSGRFGTSTDLPIDGTASGLALLDLNGDQTLDLVTVDVENSAIVTSLGDKRGGFVAVGSSPSSTRRAPLGGDFNNDGKPDLLLNNGSRLRVLLGAGDGTFPTGLDSAPLPEVPGHSMNIEQFAVGSFDGGANLDVVATVSEFASASITEFPTRLVVLGGLGDGRFGERGSWKTDRTIGALALGDLDGDGRNDLIQVGGMPASVSISLGAGDGTFSPAFEEDIGFQRPASVAIGDLNRDGLFDAVVTGTWDTVGSAVLTELLGTGGGRLRMHAQYDLRDTRTGSVALGDVDGDGKLDAITAGRGLYVALGGDDGFFGCVQHYASGVDIYSMALGDVDGDGRSDIVAASSARSVTAFLSKGR